MPAKSGASHAAAAFLSIIIGALISNVLTNHAGLVGDLIEGVGGLVASVPGISLSEDVTGLLVVSTLLAFLWGVAYHYSRHSTKQISPKNYVTDEQSPNQSKQMSATQNDSARAGARNRRYQSVQAARRAEEKLQSQLQHDLTEVKTRLDTLHDRHHDAGDRKAAERVTGLIDSVTTTERALSAGQTDPFGDKQTLDRQDVLVDTHDRLVETSAEFLETVRHVEEGENEFFETCNRLLADLDRAIAERRDAVQNMGDNR